MVDNLAEYYTIYSPHIKSYLVMAVRLSANMCDHTIHNNCADHEEAFCRANKQYAGTPYEEGDTEYYILGMCRDASCDCEGREARTDWWVDGEVRQFHYEPPNQCESVQ